MPGTPKIKITPEGVKGIKSPSGTFSPGQAIQPAPTAISVAGVKPMRTNIAYDVGQHTAFEELGLVKEAVGMLGGFRGWANAFGAGYGGAGAARKTGISGFTGGLHNASTYMKGLMAKQPGTAAKILGTTGAAAGVAGTLGTQAMFGNNSQREY